MMTNSCNKATILSLMTTSIVLVAALWPATGSGQTSSRRERSRRDASSRSDSSRTEQVTRQTSEPKSEATKPAEPNATSAKPDAAGSQSAVASEPAVPAPAEGSGQWAKYELILQRNIFSRQRTPFRPRDKSSEAPVVIPNPETHFLLKGVVQENNEFIAFVEDTQGGGVLRLKQGDRVARGAIKSLSLDALEYQLEDKTINVNLGCDLEGTRGIVPVSMVSVPALSQTSTPAATAAASGSQSQAQPQTPAASGGEADIIKRLMEQRKQQLGQ